jgi:hypothetical protein
MKVHARLWMVAAAVAIAPVRTSGCAVTVTESVQVMARWSVAVE